MAAQTLATAGISYYIMAGAAGRLRFFENAVTAISRPRGDMAIFFLIAAGVLTRYLPQLYYDITNRKRKVLVKKPSAGRAWQVFGLYVCIFAVFLSKAGRYPDSVIVIACGVSIFALGAAIGLMGLLALNRQYSEGLVRHEGATLVTRGIYGIVRHPVRAGSFCELLGMTILTAEPLLLVPLAGVLVLHHIRTRDEEAMLAEFFGEAESRYISAVPKFNFIYGLFKALRTAKPGGTDMQP